MNLKISVWSNFLHELSPEESVDAFVRLGYERMELSAEDGRRLLTRGNPTDVGRAFKRYMDDRGFAAPQGHLKMDGVDICDDNPTAVLDELKRWIELFAAVGAKNMVLHVGGYNRRLCDGEVLQRRVRSLAELARGIEGSDCFICLENLIHEVQTCESLIEIIDAVDSKNLAICLDTGHLNIHQKVESQYDFIKLAGKRLKALHLADNEGLRDQHLLPFELAMHPADPCLTRIDFSEVVRGLKEIGYDGLFNFEIPGESEAPLPVLLAKLKYVKELASYLLSLY